MNCLQNFKYDALSTETCRLMNVLQQSLKCFCYKIKLDPMIFLKQAKLMNEAFVDDTQHLAYKLESLVSMMRFLFTGMFYT